MNNNPLKKDQIHYWKIASSTTMKELINGFKELVVAYYPRVDGFYIGSEGSMNEEEFLFNYMYEKKDSECSQIEIMKHNLSDNSRPAVICYNNEEMRIIKFDDYRNEYLSKLEGYTSQKEPPKATQGKSYNSHLFIRVESEDRTQKLGVVSLQSSQKEAFTEKDIQWLENVSFYIAIALFQIKSRQTKNNNLFKSLPKISDYVSVVADKTFNEKSETLFAILKELWGDNSDQSYVFGIYDKDEKGNEKLKMTADEKYHLVEHKKFKEAGYPINDGRITFEDDYPCNVKRPGGWCYINKKPLFINDIKKDYELYGLEMDEIKFAGAETQSFLYYPLQDNNQEVFGVLSIQNREEYAYSEYDFNLFQIIAPFFAANYQLAKQKYYEIVGSCRKEFLKRYDNKGSLKEVVEVLGKILAKNFFKQQIDDFFFSICLVSDEKDALEGYGLEKGKTEPIKYPFSDENRPAIMSYFKKDMIYTGDWEDECEKKHGIKYQPPAFGSSDFKTVMYFPLLNDDEGHVLGTISVQSTKKDIFNADQKEAFKFLAQTLAFSTDIIKGKKENERMQKEAALWENLREIGRTIASQQLKDEDFPDFVKNIYNDIRQILNKKDDEYISLDIYQKDVKRNMLTMYSYEGKEDVMPKVFDIEDAQNRPRPAIGCFKETEGKSIEFIFDKFYFKDWHKDWKSYYASHCPEITERKKPIGGNDTRSLLFFPIRNRKNKNIGVISFQQETPNAFSDVNRLIIEFIAQYIGVVLENKILLEAKVDDEQNKFTANIARNIAHVMNTPIGEIGFSIMSLRGTYEKDLKNLPPQISSSINEDLDIIYNSNKEIENLVKQFKITNKGEFNSKRTRYNIKQQISDIINSPSYRKRLTALSIDIQTNYNVKTIFNVKEEIQNIITTLIDNSIEHGFENYTNSDGNQIEINVSCINESSLKIEYMDNGKGSSLTINDLFKPFKTTSGKFGRGQGLHLIKYMIEESLDGSIDAEKRSETTGLKFVIILPDSVSV